MSAQCPSCKSKIAWWNITRSFACPSCKEQLEAKTAAALFFTFVLWGFADLPLILAMPRLEESMGLFALFVRILLSALIGFAIAYVVMGSCTEITKAD